MRIYVFAPHPDDEVFGAGGPILKWLEEDHEVFIIWLTDGRAGYRRSRKLGTLIDNEETRITEEQLAEIRLAEAAASAKVLGVKPEYCFFLKYHDRDLQNHVYDAVEKVARIIKNPDRFVISSTNNEHPDHQATHDIAVKVAEKLNLKDIEFYVYAYHTALKANAEHLVTVRFGNLRFKALEALKKHRSQFFTPDLEWQSKWVEGKRRDYYGRYKLADKGKFYNF
jgi:LmbE family N-acetylglucosaminyl deacetylase